MRHYMTLAPLPFPSLADPEGVVCMNDGMIDESYCSYTVGPNACAFCEASEPATSPSSLAETGCVGWDGPNLFRYIGGHPHGDSANYGTLVAAKAA